MARSQQVRPHADAAGRAAFATVSTNCGLNAQDARRLKADPRATAKIRSLARTAPEYQRHIVGRLLAGDPNPFRMIASTLLIYDTVAFGEVTSRLHRALGLVRREAAYIDKQVSAGIAPAHLADRILTLDLIAEQAEMLTGLLAAVEIVPGKLVDRSPSKQPSGTQRKAKDTRLAAAALGLIAKNVRNVMTLQSAHRPTAEQKELALALAGEACCLAAAARDTARRAFGRADNACRVGPKTKPVLRVITHSEPDGDAVAAASLAERFLLKGQPVEVLFVPRERVLGAYRPGDCVVDVGNTHDPANLFFDHKSPAFPSRHDSCAARLVWQQLVKQGFAVDHILPLIRAVFAGDSLRMRMAYLLEHQHSKHSGFHAALARAQHAEKADAAMYRQVRRWLDRTYLP